VLTTKIRQTILHSITDIMAAVDVMDMEKEKDKDRVEDSISRILSVRRPRYRESNNDKSSNASTERGGYSEMPLPFQGENGC